MERERSREEEDSKDQLEHTVTVGGKPHKVRLKMGAHLSDLLKKFQSEHPGVTLAGMDIMCNSKIINHENGNLKEDPVLAVASTVTIAGTISGGRNLR